MSGELVIKSIISSIIKNDNKPLSIAVLASGNGSNLQALIDFSKRPTSSYAIKTVIVNTKFSKALERADKACINNHLIDHNDFPSKSAFEKKILSILLEEEIELIVLAGFMRVLSRNFLRHFENRIINLHPSLLPKHPGLDAINKALLAKDETAGCTVHLVDEGLDTGPIIAQASCPIFHDDDLEALKKRIQSLEHELLPKVVNHIAQSVFKGQ